MEVAEDAGESEKLAAGSPRIRSGGTYVAATSVRVAVKEYVKCRFFSSSETAKTIGVRFFSSSESAKTSSGGYFSSSESAKTKLGIVFVG
ncbi:predicted protein [Arabidopsis lyrata subsp. lyrata]|uniref:Predicted protein n=1 Tax=Arabidopsis lyrata subsp. lyrata TaxID=81972 RepID=D7LY39_ARALL|nr:predicted protein [Arabidopsis lyrata subsp. lyrata]